LQYIKRKEELGAWQYVSENYQAGSQIFMRLRSALNPFRIDFKREHGKEHAVRPNQSIEQLSDYQLLKKSRAP